MPGPRPPLPNDSRLSPTPRSKHGAEPTEQRLALRELLVTFAITVTSGGFSKDGRLRRGLVVRRGGKESIGVSPRYNLGRERLCPPRPFREPVEYFLWRRVGSTLDSPSRVRSLRPKRGLEGMLAAPLGPLRDEGRASVM